MKTTLILRLNNYILPVFLPVVIQLPKSVHRMTSEDILQAVLKQTDYCSSDNFTILTDDLYYLSSTAVPIPLSYPVTAHRTNPFIR